MAGERSPEGSRFEVALPEGPMSALRWGKPDRAPDLVFCHATGFNAATYRPLLSQFGSHSVVAPDLRGHGLTRLPADPARLFDWRGYAADLGAALDRLGVSEERPAVLAGHSMGGLVSLFAAAARQGRIRRLVLLDPVLMHPLMRFALYTRTGRVRARRFSLSANAAKRRPTFPSKDAALEIWRTRKTFASWQPGFLEGYVDGGFVEDGDGVRLACAPEWEAATFAAHRHDSWGALRSLRIPVHVMLAADGTTVYGGAERLKRVLPAVTVETLPGTTHFFPMERPDRVAAVLHAALAKT
jgi:pimeloyl-ACP methyl ester carboxylesterase